MDYLAAENTKLKIDDRQIRHSTPSQKVKKSLMRVFQLESKAKKSMKVLRAGLTAGLGLQLNHDNTSWTREMTNHQLVLTRSLWVRQKAL